ncbi:hypothetical protein [Chryseobacterium sp. T1]
MDKITKQQILNDCNSYTFTVETLDNFVEQGHISIDEFVQFNLEIGKVNELKKRQQLRGEAVILPPPPPPPIIDKKREEIEKVINNKIKVEEIMNNIRLQVYSYEDLLGAGLSQRLVTSLKYYETPRIVRSYKVEELPTMQAGRTDLFFIGLPATGKSTMLAGLLKYAHKKGIIIPDSYNNAGNVYQAQLLKDLDFGVVPKGTKSGSYNYIATSLKDQQGATHPFNIVEVPGENYNKIFNEGIDTEEVQGFIKYVKNSNKKILIFVIDALANENKFEVDMFDELDQSTVYINILNMFRDHGVLEQTEAIYLVVNKFDVLKESRFAFSNGSDPDHAMQFLEEEFLGLVNNCKDARDRSKNKFQIKIFPYSIGNVKYDKILEGFDTVYPQVILDNLLKDSFVIKGGKFWGKLF